MSKRKLGRGLGSLLAGRTEVVREGGSAAEVPVDRIQPNRWQPREPMSDESLAGLVESVRRDGVLQPVVVRRLEEGRFELVAGERRWRAAAKAGMATVPAVIREVAEERLLELALIENVQREDLNPIEQARAYRQVLVELDVTQEEAAKRLGQQRSTLANSLRLLELPEAIQELVSRGTLSAGHGRAILGIRDEAAQMALARRIVKEGLSVRATEDAVSGLAGRAKTARGGSREKPAHLRDLEDRLKRLLGTRVTIRERRKGGRLIIDFKTHEEFERVLEKLGVETSEEL